MIVVGAKPLNTLPLLLGHGARLTAGVTAGTAVASRLTRILTGMLYQVSASDLPTFAAAALLRAAVAIAACLIPAKKVAEYRSDAAPPPRISLDVPAYFLYYAE